MLKFEAKNGNLGGSACETNEIKDRIAHILKTIKERKIDSFYKGFGGFNKWIEAAKNGDLQAKYSLKAIVNAMKTNNKINNAYSHLSCNRIDDCLINFCKKNIHTVFIIFLPPYHKIYWKTEASNAGYELYYTRVKYLLQNSQKYKNIIVFGFDNDSFTADISRYKDRVHYDEKINSYILNAIREKTHILTLENIDEYFRKMKKDIQTYDLNPFYDQIKNLKELKS